MNRKTRYSAQDKMCDLVCRNYSILFVLSRFGIPVGFGDACIQDVCEKNGVDTSTFLAIVNLNLNGINGLEMSDRNLSPEAIVKYLHNSHDYFLSYRLPSIRARLLEALEGQDQQDVSVVVMRFFDEYVKEVRKHMQYEEKTVFPYIRSLLKGEKDTSYHISVFQKQHDQVETRLNELRDILIKYYTGKAGNLFNAVLFDIFTCSEDLREHNLVEDGLLIPLIQKLEK